MKELEYPFDNGYIMKKKRSLRRDLLADGTNDTRIKKKIAVLGGSTTADIVAVLDLFLLDCGVECEFYQSEYGQYWQDAVFPNEELISFAPDFIFVHTSIRNLAFTPNPRMSAQETERGFENEVKRFSQMWDSLAERFHCPVIQNNFELPFFRLMGNSEASDFRGRVNFVNRMNLAFAQAAQERSYLYINDINWLSAMYGLEKWSAPEYWYMYKYSLNINAIPELAYQTAAIIKSLLGKNKKALAVDLDNTMWGGIVGDDGAENLEIGQETAEAMAFYEWQSYVKSLKDIGVVLTVCSKNEEENALAGLRHPEGAVSPEDFTVIKANWLPKDKNISDTAQELNILPEAIVFADDNPAERDIVRSRLRGVKVPEIGSVTDYIRVLDRCEFFEVTSLSEDDLKRGEMYKANAERAKAQAEFESYGDYLKSLEMKAEIGDFKPVYIQRITQLTNKTNQFNLTARRYTPAEMEEVFRSDRYIRLYGKLEDRFGDNGVVSVIIGEIRGDTLEIILWLMSCRVLKRDMELAMLDCLVKSAKKRGIRCLNGIYIPTAKNKMVKDFYGALGFANVCVNSEGVSIWELDIQNYADKNTVIDIMED